MKKIFSILMVAFAMTAMVACDEKENEPETTASDLADNTLVYDGTTYHMVAGQSFYHTGLTTVDAGSQETDGSGNSMVEFFGLHIRPTMWNKTVDVLTVNNDEETWQCGFQGVLFGEYSDVTESFSACKIGIKGNNDGSPVTVTLDGTMKNGKTLQMKLVTNSQYK